MLKPTIIMAVVAGMVIPARGIAGEVIKFKSHNYNVVAKWEQSDLGDETGHIRANMEIKGIGVRHEGPREPMYKVDIWGSGDYSKAGTGRERGFTKYTFSDGSYSYEEWIGKSANGRDVGTAVYYGGGGRFKDVKGGGKYDCMLMGDRFVCEVEGTLELP